MNTWISASNRAECSRTLYKFIYVLMLCVVNHRFFGFEKMQYRRLIGRSSLQIINLHTIRSLWWQHSHWNLNIFRIDFNDSIFFLYWNQISELFSIPLARLFSANTHYDLFNSLRLIECVLQRKKIIALAEPMMKY